MHLQRPVSFVDRGDLADSLERILDRSRAVEHRQEHSLKALSLLRPLAGVSGVARRAHVILNRPFGLAPPIPQVSGYAERPCEPGLVSGTLVERDCIPELAPDLALADPLRIDVQPHGREGNSGIDGDRSVPGHVCRVDGLGQHLFGAMRLPRLAERPAQIRQQADPSRVVWREQGGGSLQEARGGAHVTSRVRSAAR